MSKQILKPIPIKTSTEVLKKFKQIKLDLNLKNLNEVFEVLLKNFKKTKS